MSAPLTVLTAHEEWNRGTALLHAEKVERETERVLLDDLAAYARETRGFVEDSQTGSGFHARQLRALLVRHQALVAAR